MSEDADTIQKMVSNFQELDLQEVLGSPTWMLGTELGSFSRTISSEPYL